MKASIGIKDGAITGRAAVKWFVQKIMELDDELAVIEKQINQKCQEIPHAGNILEISGIGENTLSGILAQMGNISRFDDVKEIQAVAPAKELKALHAYYTTRADNPLKKMHSLIVIACKLLRIIYTILKKGTVYNPKKMLRDIRRPKKKEVVAE